ncbi:MULTISPECIES: potassium transporter TrkG [unclassified Solwaraspora]|uniref:TrkH family potassium uptake protein n=1 Tax=unclassified Solwaraspora TaxID=2627926 RepID=UPI00248C090B|nr:MULTISPECIES: potassium transporter TrkG [unclassified Solwaraspora]WBC19672.1 TrkH family potassium uptake protein [Solwaraspora sp. WMMA2080]WJK32747.1 potassium transporter TrkG [Solwaraspora sp. WMMA2065]
MRRPLRNPARIVPIAFLGAIAVGTVLMMVPASRQGPDAAPFVTALFTATSAVCVTGLAVTDTPAYWSPLGLVLITLLTQLGGFGIMSLATLLGLLVSRRLGLRSRLTAQAETNSLALSDIRRVLLRIAATMLGAETAIALVLAARLWLHYDYPPPRALWYGLFHAVQAFNNGGFALYSDGLVQFVGDWWICLPLIVGVVVGGLGFPALFELARERSRPRRWSVHTRLTVWGTLALIGIGFVSMLTFEWANPRTLGPLDLPEKLLAALFQDVMTRSGGFNTVDLGELNPETTAASIGMMFIGGGSASTAGGIKVTTFFLLAFVIWSELRGEHDVVIGRRRIAAASQRQALTVALIGVALVGAGTLALISLTDDIGGEQALYEVTSAFGTTGLSTGITGDLPDPAQVLLVVLMFVGRIGSVTLGSAIALNTRRRRFHYPEERPIVG